MYLTVTRFCSFSSISVEAELAASAASSIEADVAAEAASVLSTFAEVASDAASTASVAEAIASVAEAVASVTAGAVAGSSTTFPPLVISAVASSTAPSVA